MQSSQHSIQAQSHSAQPPSNAVINFALPDDVRSVDPERYDHIKRRVPTGWPDSNTTSVFDSEQKQSLAHGSLDDDTIVPESEDTVRSYRDAGQKGGSTSRAPTVGPR